jgi:hypothetical protein
MIGDRVASRHHHLAPEWWIRATVWGIRDEEGRRGSRRLLWANTGHSLLASAAGARTSHLERGTRFFGPGVTQNGNPPTLDQPIRLFRLRPPRIHSAICTLPSKAMQPLHAPRGYRAAIVVVLVSGAIGAFMFPVNHDVAWLLYVASQIANGARPYIDVVENNPPLIIFFNLLIELLARVLGLWNVTVYRVVFLLLLLTSLFLNSRTLKLAIGGDTEGIRLQLLLALAFVLVPLVGYDFGEREHLTLALVLPYLISAAAWQRGCRPSRRMAVLVGVLAGIGLAMKPYFLLVPAAVELYLARVRGTRIWLRAENVTIVAVHVAYVIAAFFFTPAFFPLARWTAKLYGAYHPVSRLGIVAGPIGALGLVCVWADIRTREGSRARELRSVLLVATWSFIAAAAIQGKGWPYHLYPALALGIVFLSLVIIEPQSSADARQGRGAVLPQVRAGILAGALVISSLYAPKEAQDAWRRYDADPSYYSGLAKVVGEHSHSGPIYAMHTVVRASFPLVNYTGVRWGSRFNTLWMLAGLYDPMPEGDSIFPYHAPSEMGEIERYLIDAVVTDLERSEPSVLIIDKAPPGGVRLRGFDYLEYFLRDCRFARLFAAYERLPDVDRFRIYVRRNGRVPDAL